jgi:hypothetical protein
MFLLMRTRPALLVFDKRTYLNPPAPSGYPTGHEVLYMGGRRGFIFPI